MKQRDSAPLYTQRYPLAQVMSKNNEERPGQQSIVMPPPNQNHVLLGPESTVTTCVFCKANIKTTVKFTNNTRTHIAAALWCRACCMCCVPYSSESAQNSDHYCPNCQRYLGTYHK